MKHAVRSIAFVVSLLLAVTVLAFSSAGHSFASGSAGHLRTPINWHPQSGAGPVAGSYATLNTRSNGASFTFHADQLKPHHVYTLWVVILNAPENCATSPCTAADGLGNTDAVQANITYGAGHVAGNSAKGTFAGFVAAGEMPDGWYTNDFSNPLGAEIHLVLNDHGPMIPELVSNMLHSYRGGCTDASLPPPFPASAKADGTPGPNNCRLYQVAIFQQ